MGILNSLFGSREMKDETPKPLENATTTGNFYFIVDDVFTITGRGTVVTGKVDSGEVHIGDTVSISERMSSEVVGIEMFRKTADSAREGDTCGILLKGINRNDIHKGDYLTK